jgi:hypothetical protein
MSSVIRNVPLFSSTINYDSIAGEYGRFDFYIDLKVYEILGSHR